MVIVRAKLGYDSGGMQLYNDLIYKSGRKIQGPYGFFEREDCRGDHFLK